MQNEQKTILTVNVFFIQELKIFATYNRKRNKEANKTATSGDSSYNMDEQADKIQTIGVEIKNKKPAHKRSMSEEGIRNEGYFIEQKQTQDELFVELFEKPPMINQPQPHDIQACTINKDTILDTDIVHKAPTSILNANLKAETTKDKVLPNTRAQKKINNQNKKLTGDNKAQIKTRERKSQAALKRETIANLKNRQIQIEKSKKVDSPVKSNKSIVSPAQLIASKEVNARRARKSQEAVRSPSKKTGGEQEYKGKQLKQPKDQLSSKIGRISPVIASYGISNLTSDPDARHEAVHIAVLANSSAEDFAHMSRKFLKKMAKELVRVYGLNQVQAENIAKEMETRIVNALRSDSNLSSDEAVFKTEYTEKILELVRNIKEKLVEMNQFLQKTEDIASVSHKSL